MITRHNSQQTYPCSCSHECYDITHRYTHTDRTPAQHTHTWWPCAVYWNPNLSWEYPIWFYVIQCQVCAIRQFQPTKGMRDNRYSQYNLFTELQLQYYLARTLLRVSNSVEFHSIHGKFVRPFPSIESTMAHVWSIRYGEEGKSVFDKWQKRFWVTSFSALAICFSG